MYILGTHKTENIFFFPTIPVVGSLFVFFAWIYTGPLRVRSTFYCYRYFSFCPARVRAVDTSTVIHGHRPDSTRFLLVRVPGNGRRATAPAKTVSIHKNRKKKHAIALRCPSPIFRTIVLRRFRVNSTRARTSVTSFYFVRTVSIPPVSPLCLLRFRRTSNR